MENFNHLIEGLSKDSPTVVVRSPTTKNPGALTRIYPNYKALSHLEENSELELKVSIYVYSQ